MNKKYLRAVVAAAIVLATIAVFVYYFIKHPGTLDSLKSVPVTTLGILLVLYAAFIGTLVWIQQATLELCDVKLGAREATLLMMYSAVINFFGPLQSGPAFRAAYLKKKHNASLKKYTLATLAYYGLYAAFSGLLLVAFILKWWTLLAVALVIILAPVLFRLKRFRELDLKNLRSLALATLAQSAVQSVIYFVELHTLAQHVSYIQALIYTGAANFALFVSLTPGAIGFRESFLLLSQKLHHIGAGIIAVASLVDRAVYIVLLVIMAALIFGFHANDYLKGRPAKGQRTAAREVVVK